MLAVCLTNNPALAQLPHSARVGLIAAAVGTAVVAALPTLPPVFSRLARRLGVGRLSPAVAEKLAGFDYRTLICGWAVMLLGWLAMGASLWATLRGRGLEANLTQSWYLYTAITAMAVVGGFVSMIPAGLVVSRGSIHGPACLFVALRAENGPDRGGGLALDVAPGGTADFDYPISCALGVTQVVRENMLSIVIPVYNEAESLKPCTARSAKWPWPTATSST